MKFPYGISDFARLIRDAYVYVDRTDRIALLEASGPQLVFLRPRRFGKNLLLSMLANYYDVARADRFESPFRIAARLSANPGSTDVTETRRDALPWNLPRFQRSPSKSA